MYKANFDYTPSELESAENCISLREGQSVTKVRELGNGWSAGYNVISAKTGIFPSDYIEAIKGWEGTVQYDISGRNVGDLPMKPTKPPVTGTGNDNVIKEIRHSINVDKETGILRNVHLD